MAEVAKEREGGKCEGKVGGERKIDAKAKRLRSGRNGASNKGTCGNSRDARSFIRILYSMYIPRTH